MAGTPFEERVTVSRRHREPALAVQIELRDAAKHKSPFGRAGTFDARTRCLSHFLPLLPTIFKEERPVKRRWGVFFLSDKDLCGGIHVETNRFWILKFTSETWY